MKPMNNETMNGDNNTSGAAAHLAHYAGENEVNDDMVAKVTNVIQAHQCLAKAGAVKNADLLATVAPQSLFCVSLLCTTWSSAGIYP